MIAELEEAKAAWDECRGKGGLHGCPCMDEPCTLASPQHAEQRVHNHERCRRFATDGAWNVTPEGIKRYLDLSAEKAWRE